jgi:hypothetical protein
MGFPYRFAFTFPQGGDDDTAGPSITFGVAAGSIHENREITVSVADLSSISYVRIEIHYPTGYYEVAYETPEVFLDQELSVPAGQGWGQFYTGSTTQALEPIEGIAKQYTIVRDLHWPNAFEIKATARDNLGNVTPL